MLCQMWARRPPRRPQHGAPQAGEILPSTTVRDLVIGSELQLTARGEGELKGIPEGLAVYGATVWSHAHRSPCRPAL